MDSLHWFESVERTLSGEQERVEAQRSGERDFNLQNTLTLTLKRIQTNLREFQLLKQYLLNKRLKRPNYNRSQLSQQLTQLLK